jgi:hypothetical protein
VQLSPSAQAPHVPPQPSSPQVRLAQSGAHPLVTQVPAWQPWPPGQVPQEPPQPSSPQVRLPQAGVQPESWQRPA